MHLFKNMFKDTYKESKKDLDMQEKMNLAFIKGLPKTSGLTVKEFGRESEEFAVPEVIPPEKIKIQKKKMKFYGSQEKIN